MAAVTRARVRSLLDSFEQIWLYVTLFVLLTGQIILLNDLALRKAPGLAEISWVYQLITLGFVVVLARPIVLHRLPDESANTTAGTQEA